MVDRSCIGRILPPHTADVEPGRLRFFAKAVGETRPEYVDEEAARAAGLPGLLALPTYALCLDLDVPDAFAWLRDLGVDLPRVLHGAQSFRYFAPIHAGDRLTFAARIEDVYEKRGGALTFIVKETDVTNQDGVKVAEMRATIIVRGG